MGSVLIPHLSLLMKTNFATILAACAILGAVLSIKKTRPISSAVTSVKTYAKKSATNSVLTLPFLEYGRNRSDRQGR
jgi:hypothetical protein